MTTALPATNAAPKTRRVGHRGSAGATTVRPPRGHGPVDRWSSRPRLAVVPRESASGGSGGGGAARAAPAPRPRPRRARVGGVRGGGARGGGPGGGGVRGGGVRGGGVR